MAPDSSDDDRVHLDLHSNHLHPLLSSSSESGKENYLKARVDGLVCLFISLPALQFFETMSIDKTPTPQTDPAILGQRVKVRERREAIGESRGEIWSSPSKARPSDGRTDYDLMYLPSSQIPILDIFHIKAQFP